MNQRTLLLHLLCAATASCLSAAEDPNIAERQKLVGTWKGFTVEGRGEPPDRGPVKLELRITESAMKGLEFKGTNVVDHGVGEFATDVSQNPKCLDAWKTSERGRKQQYIGIYTIEGETLKWCVSPQKVRPQTFETKKGQFLLILKRQNDTAAFKLQTLETQKLKLYRLKPGVPERRGG